jgi:hypothetical protein
MNGHAVDVIVHTVEIIVGTVVVRAIEVVGIKVYLIAVAIGAVAIITNMLGNKIAVIYGVIDVKMNMAADVIVGKTATASKLNTGNFAKRTPGISHLHLMKSRIVSVSPWRAPISSARLPCTSSSRPAFAAGAMAGASGAGADS